MINLLTVARVGGSAGFAAPDDHEILYATPEQRLSQDGAERGTDEGLDVNSWRSWPGATFTMITTGIRCLGDFIVHGRKVGGRRTQVDVVRPRRYEGRRKLTEANGIEVYSRGRIPTELVDRYKAAGN